MKNLSSRWNLVQVVICTGIVCIAIGFANNYINIAYAQPGCANNAPNFALCESGPWPTCPQRSENCDNEEHWDVKSGEFRCEMPSPGTACITSTSSAPCYTIYMCRSAVAGSKCLVDREGPDYPFSAALKEIVDCPS